MTSSSSPTWTLALVALAVISTAKYSYGHETPTYSCASTSFGSIPSDFVFDDTCIAQTTREGCLATIHPLSTYLSCAWRTQTASSTSDEFYHYFSETSSLSLNFLLAYFDDPLFQDASGRPYCALTTEASLPKAAEGIYYFEMYMWADNPWQVASMCMAGVEGASRSCTTRMQTPPIIDDPFILPVIFVHNPVPTTGTGMHSIFIKNTFQFNYDADDDDVSLRRSSRRLVHDDDDFEGPLVRPVFVDQAVLALPLEKYAIFPTTPYGFSVHQVVVTDAIRAKLFVTGLKSQKRRSGRHSDAAASSIYAFIISEADYDAYFANPDRATCIAAGACPTPVSAAVASCAVRPDDKKRHCDFTATGLEPDEKYLFIVSTAFIGPNVPDPTPVTVRYWHDSHVIPELTSSTLSTFSAQHTETATAATADGFDSSFVEKMVEEKLGGGAAAQWPPKIPGRL